jgi:hypothetical protein
VGVAELALERLELSSPDPQSSVLSKLNYRACNLMVECSLDKRVAVVRFHPGPSLVGTRKKRGTLGVPPEILAVYRAQQEKHKIKWD